MFYGFRRRLTTVHRKPSRMQLLISSVKYLYSRKDSGCVLKPLLRKKGRGAWQVDNEVTCQHAFFFYTYDSGLCVTTVLTLFIVCYPQPPKPISLPGKTGMTVIICIPLCADGRQTNFFKLSISVSDQVIFSSKLHYSWLINYL